MATKEEGWRECNSVGGNQNGFPALHHGAQLSKRPLAQPVTAAAAASRVRCSATRCVWTWGFIWVSRSCSILWRCSEE